VSNLRRKFKPGSKAGFTLTEVIVVMIILAVIAATAIPSVIGFIRHGQQINRANIARTMYTAMQNQLSRASVEGNLRAVLTDAFYVEGTNELIAPTALRGNTFSLLEDNGFILLDSFSPEELAANRDNVFTIHKPLGYERSAIGAETVVDLFYDMLDEIIVDREILNGAITMEFNVLTGVIMSIFYSDNISQMQDGNAHAYTGNGDRNDIVGGRGMGAGGYADDYTRRQGFYGVNTTGEVQLPHMDIVNIYDGMHYVEADGYETDDKIGDTYGVGLKTNAGTKINILFAEFLLAPDFDQEGRERSFSIFRDESSPADTGNWGQINIANPVATPYVSFAQAISSTLNPEIPGEHAIYRDGTRDVEVHGILIQYARFIWVIDYIEGDLIASSPHSIFSRVDYQLIANAGPTNARASVSRGTSTINSPMTANTHFANMLNNNAFAISSARHLNNIRENLTDSIYSTNNRKFVQITDIDMATTQSASGAQNFKPISLTTGGSYSAIKDADKQWTISNLIIDTNPGDTIPAPPAPHAAYNGGNVGLFTHINGNKEVNVTGISLINATIHAPNALNVGAIAGLLDNGAIISRSNSYANVTGGNTALSRTGGLVGRIDSQAAGELSTLSHSFNAGFYNTIVGTATATDGNFGSVTARAGGIGGLVGDNNGVVQMTYNNARINVDTVEIGASPWYLSAKPTFTLIEDSILTYLGGLVGYNNTNGVIRNSYATNYVAAYEENDYAHSGGIAGWNVPIALTETVITNVHYIANGCKDFGNSVSPNDRRFATTKDELSEVGNIGASGVRFEPDTSAGTMYFDEYSTEQKNIYYRYPYPILVNNKPYMTADDTHVGWEDIDVVVVSPVMLVYFEKYAGGEIRFGSGAFTPNLISAPNHPAVIEAGYMLLVNPKEETTIDAVYASLGLFVRPSEPDEPGGSSYDWTRITYAPFTEMNSNPNMPSGYGGYYYTILELGTLESALSPERNLLLNYCAAYGTGAGDPASTYIEEKSGYFHPLFANSVTNEVHTYNYEVRTPWQMQNIDMLTLLRNDPEIKDEWDEGSEWAKFFLGDPPGPQSSNNHNGDAVTGTTSADAVTGRARLRALLDTAPNVDSAVNTVVPEFSEGTEYSFAGSTPANTINAASLAAFRAAHPDANYLIVPAGVTIAGPLTMNNIEYLYIRGALHISGNVNMPDLMGMVVTGNLTVAANSNIRGNPADNIGSSIVVGGTMTVQAGTTTDTTPFAGSQIHDCRFYVTGNITLANTTSSRSIIQGNSVYMSQGSITLGTGGNNTNIGTMERFPQFYSRSGIGYAAHSNAQYYGIFATLGNITRTSGNGAVEYYGLFMGANIQEPPSGPLGDRLEPITWPNPNNALNLGLTHTVVVTEPDWEPNPEAHEFNFFQTRNMDFTADVGYSSLAGGARGDGTTPNLTGKYAVVEKVFVGGYYGGRLDTNESFTISNVTISGGLNEAYGLFSDNAGHIERVILRTSSITATNATGNKAFAGGLAGINHGTIIQCQLQSVTVAGRLSTGGVAGVNKNIGWIGLTSVQNSTVNGNGAVETGGVTGTNHGRIIDVSFLSRNLVNDPPVSNGGGGIVGYNSLKEQPTDEEDTYYGVGEVTQALYIAPAPFTTDTAGNKLIHPIVGTGNSAYERPTGPSSSHPTTFYLSGYRYTLNEGITWEGPAPEVFDEYNLLVPPVGSNPGVLLRGGGQGLMTMFFDREWISFIYGVDLTNWFQPTRGYPYPVIRGMLQPALWVETEGPERPEQVERTDWLTPDNTTERPRAPLFVNGDFTMPFRNPLIMNYNVPASSWLTRNWFLVDFQEVEGWYTRPSPGFYYLFNPNGVGSLTPPVDAYMFPQRPSSNQWEDFRNGTGDAARQLNAAGTTAANQAVNNDIFNTAPPGGRATGALQTANPLPPGGLPQGLTEFPTYPGTLGTVANRAFVQTPRWRLIEIQEPNARRSWMPTNYLGRSKATTAANPFNSAVNNVQRYVELNAQSPGTLYQVLPSTPDATFMYSFYHASRITFSSPNAATYNPASDRMNFYLSPFNEGTTMEVSTEPMAVARDTALVMIRPCLSPRIESTGLTGITEGSGANEEVATSGRTANAGQVQNSVMNPRAWWSINYGASNVSGLNGYNLNYHRNREYLQPTGFPRVQDDIPANHVYNPSITTTPIYLYDVWVGDISTSNPAGTYGGYRGGYGITFWSTANLTIGTAGQAGLDGIIPLEGITQAQLLDGGATWAWLAQARTNVIGYWGVSYGWKHYYGEYTVPELQSTTEFAFQSASTTPNDGNFLDGISFRSPAFVTINKAIKNTAGTDVVTSVGPGEVLTVELNIKNLGEVPANEISIKDQLRPFTEYIEFVPGTVRIGGAAAPAGAVELDIDGVTVNAVNISLGTEVLEYNQELRVTFQIKVRDYVKGFEGYLKTLLYRFDNQAVVSYHQGLVANTTTHPAPYATRTHSNASNITEVYINPIELSKTVTPSTNTGPFRVTLTIKNTFGSDAKFTTSGMITEIIPANFRLTQIGTYTITDFSVGTTAYGDDIRVTRNEDGTTTLIITNVNIDASVDTLVYTYTLRYTGSNFGVTHLVASDIARSSVYRYVYTDEDDDIVALMSLMSFPQPVVGIYIGARDYSFAASGTEPIVRNLTQGIDLNGGMEADGYTVEPAVVFTTSTGTPLTAAGNPHNIADQVLTFTDLGNLQRLANANFEVEVTKGTGNIEFWPIEPGVYTLYYRISLTAEKAGAPSFNLHSGVRTITIFVLSEDEVVYFEQYNDSDHYGYYTANGDLNTLENDNSFVITDSGYGVLSSSGTSVVISHTVRDKIDLDSVWLYILDINPAVNLNLQDIWFGPDGDPDIIGYIHPNFAKQVYDAAGDATSPFEIRTPQQMMNIGELSDTDGKTFIQTRNLDFDVAKLSAAQITALNNTGAVVKGEFEGTFVGGYPDSTISNLTINSPTHDNVGLFSHNSGTIRDVMLRPDTSITGRNNVGGIAGHNDVNGEIRDCDVSGDPLTGEGMHIKGTETVPGTGINVGGIAGLNDGLIEDCIVSNATSTIEGADFIGGIAGRNGADGEILNCEVKNVTIRSDGYNVGAIVGGNDNTDPDSLDGSTATDVVGKSGDGDPRDIEDVGGGEPDEPDLCDCGEPEEDCTCDTTTEPCACAEDPCICCDECEKPEEDCTCDTTTEPEPCDCGLPECEECNPINGTQGYSEIIDFDALVEDGVDGFTASRSILMLPIFGGYGFTRTKIFRNFIRRRDARAIRKINEHNDRKRAS